MLIKKSSGRKNYSNEISKPIKTDMTKTDLKKLVGTLAKKKQQKAEPISKEEEEEIEDEEETIDEEVKKDNKPKVKLPEIDDDTKIAMRIQELQNNGVFRAELLFYLNEIATQHKKFVELFQSLIEEDGDE